MAVLRLGVIMKSNIRFDHLPKNEKLFALYVHNDSDGFLCSFSVYCPIFNPSKV